MTLLGQEIIKATSKNLPNQPGVYQMQDDKGNILYIGKAKILSNPATCIKSFIYNFCLFKSSIGINSGKFGITPAVQIKP